MSNYTTEPKANAHPRIPSLIAPLWICVGFEQQRRERTRDTEYQVWQHRVQSILMCFPKPAAHRAGQHPAVPRCPLLEHPAVQWGGRPANTIPCLPKPSSGPCKPLPWGSSPVSLCPKPWEAPWHPGSAHCQIYLGNAVVRLSPTAPQ